jgi:hypothetical protein
MTDDRRDPERDDRRTTMGADRRARTRGGRRVDDAKHPWWIRHRMWLAFASVMFVGWRRLVGRKARA